MKRGDPPRKDSRRHSAAEAIPGQARNRRRDPGRRARSRLRASARNSVAPTSTPACWPIRTPGTPHHQGMQQEMVQLAAAFSAQVSFMEPEILKFEKGTTVRFSGQRATAEEVRVLPRRYRAPLRSTPSATRRKRYSPRPVRSAAPVECLRPAGQCRLPLPDRDAERR